MRYYKCGCVDVEYADEDGRKLFFLCSNHQLIDKNGYGMNKEYRGDE